MTFTQKLTLGFVSFLIPATVIAAPGNVKSVQAAVQNGQVTVIWSEVAGAAGYNIYYSRESILQNGGDYDDVVASKGAGLTYTFPSFPVQTSKMYVSVLAVDAAGVESEGFETETSVDLPAAAAVSSSVSSTAPVPASSSSVSSASSFSAMPVGENPTTTSQPMAVVSVRAVSSTGVLVTFTKDVKTDAQVDMSSFLMTTGSGTMFSIIKVDITGKDVLLTTNVQKPDEQYIFSLLRVVPATDGTNATPSEPQVRFAAFGSGNSGSSSSGYGRNPQLPTSSSSSQPQVAPPQNPAYLNLSAAPRADGTYNVLANWGLAPGAEAFSLYTSRNNAAYLMGSTLSASQTKVQYDGIEPGTFGVRVTAKNAAGESSGIEKSINLPASGLGIFGIAGAAGALAARKMKRRKTVIG